MSLVTWHSSVAALYIFIIPLLLVGTVTMWPWMFKWYYSSIIIITITFKMQIYWMPKLFPRFAIVNLRFDIEYQLVSLWIQCCIHMCMTNNNVKCKINLELLMILVSFSSYLPNLECFSNIDILWPSVDLHFVIIKIIVVKLSFFKIQNIKDTIFSYLIISSTMYEIWSDFDGTLWCRKFINTYRYIFDCIPIFTKFWMFCLQSWFIIPATNKVI